MCCQIVPVFVQPGNQSLINCPCIRGLVNDGGSGPTGFLSEPFREVLNHLKYSEKFTPEPAFRPARVLGHQEPGGLEVVCGVGNRERSSNPLLETIFLHFTIQRRTANAQSFGHLRHVTAITPEGQPDHIGFDGVKRANVAAV